MPTTIGDSLRYLYYDKRSDNFIFHIGNIEEIYVIQNMFARRFGFSIIADNSSISSLIIFTNFTESEKGIVSSFNLYLPYIHKLLQIYI